MVIYWIVAKNKKTGTKLNWDKIRNKLSQFYPDCTISLVQNEYGTSMKLQGSSELTSVYLNKTRYMGSPVECEYNSIPKNSFLFHFDQPNHELIKNMRLCLLQ